MMKETPSSKRIIVYHQTHFSQGEFISVLPLLDTSVTHVIVAAIHLNDQPGDITLNDDPYTDPKLEPLWAEVRTLQSQGVKVLGMVGGAAKGSYSRLDNDSRYRFEAFYRPLERMIRFSGFDGVDLDVEEHMSLPGIVRLIDALKKDFGDSFIITLAPVATALRGPWPPFHRNLSGFSYSELEKALGPRVAWYNCQFYCNWGNAASTSEYDDIISRGWPADKVVLGLITSPESGDGWVDDDTLRDVLSSLVAKYPAFGGVMGWEYFGSFTLAEESAPGCWARLMTEVLYRE